MNTQTLLLTELTPQEEENVSGGNPYYELVKIIVGVLIQQGLDPNSAYQRAVQDAGRGFQRYGLWLRGRR